MGHAHTLLQVRLMPIRPDLRRHYGYTWRTITRPAALTRAGHECERCALPDRPTGLRSSLEGAHLNGNPADIGDSNIAILCHRCHKAVDYTDWARKCRQTRIERKDAARPILAMLLQEAS
jgi:hypothetical protein